jgi:hypothetical protein
MSQEGPKVVCYHLGYARRPGYGESRTHGLVSNGGKQQDFCPNVKRNDVMFIIQNAIDPTEADDTDNSSGGEDDSSTEKNGDDSHLHEDQKSRTLDV